MIEKTEFGWTGSITDLPTWGTEPGMGLPAVLVTVMAQDINIKIIKEAIVGLVKDSPTACNDANEAMLQLERLEKLFAISDMALAGIMYTAYCERVGGVAYDGKPLPTWDEFSTDPAKKKQTLGWVAAARVARMRHDTAS